MKLKLIERKPRFTDVESFIFEPEQPIDWQAGQYLHYDFPHQNQDERGQERWFTISAPPYEKNIMITTRFTPDRGSSFKHALKDLKIGDTIQADGPKGKFIVDDLSKKHILIAGGIGITPYRAMLLQLDHDGKDINAELLYANRDDDFVFGDELSELEKKHPNFHVHKIVERRLNEEDFKPYADDPNSIFYVSGPEPMVENYAELLQNMGVPEERIKTDFFPGY